jgi:hypothetical protein
MSYPTESYLRVQYELRAAKQVERRMIIDTLQMLALTGFHISEYQYTGFGSVYFVDFILFHKLLGIKRMLSAEDSLSIKKRVDFNKPFDCVEVKMGSIGDVIPQLSKDREHLLWLDYDSVLSEEHLQDTWLAAAHLPRRSVLLVTIDVEPPDDSNNPRDWRLFYQRIAGDYIGPLKSVKDFAKSKLPTVNRDIVVRAIQSGLAGREVEFLPLFCFLYADGHRMLTIGGMIGGEEEKLKIAGTSLLSTTYLRLDLKAPPYEIRVPCVTRKERLYLDRAMPCRSKWKPKEFELPEEDIAAYREIYRFFPAYAELLL